MTVFVLWSTGMQYHNVTDLLLNYNPKTQYI
jgi:hypothetical protein